MKKHVPMVGVIILLAILVMEIPSLPIFSVHASTAIATPTTAASSINVQPIRWLPSSTVSQSMIQNTQPMPDSTTAAQAATIAPQAATITTQVGTNAATDQPTAGKMQIRTVHFWTSSFDYQGQNYPYSMVGRDPSKGSSITLVPTVLVPVKLTLSNGAVYDGSTKANAVARSPLFQFTSLTSGFTQYNDAMQRAEFWQYIANQSALYHVWLLPPARFPMLSLNVPADMGQPLTLKSGKVVAGVDINYLDAQFVSYMQANNISPTTMPIFLSYNTMGTLQNGTQCCIGGYHNAIANANNTAIQTYAYAEYGDTGLSASNPTLFSTTDALSHELAEWMNDPFGNNVAPNWMVASQPQYGCSNVLEVGDPLVGVGFDVNGYHLQDEAFFSWFARQSPSIGINGMYTYLGSFSSFSTPC